MPELAQQPLCERCKIGQLLSLTFKGTRRVFAYALITKIEPDGNIIGLVYRADVAASPEWCTLVPGNPMDEAYIYVTFGDRTDVVIRLASNAEINEFTFLLRDILIAH